MIWLISLWLSLSAQTFKPECPVAVKKTIENPAFATALVKDSRVVIYDCMAFIPPVPDSWMSALVVLSTPLGTETHLLVLDQKKFASVGDLITRSESLGFDAFPMWFNGQLTLGFVMPKVEYDRVGIYMNLQTSPAVTRLSRWDLDLKSKSLNEVINRAWMMDAGVQAKIYSDNGVWRALIQQRAVEL